MWLGSATLALTLFLKADPFVPAPDPRPAQRRPAGILTEGVPALPDALVRALRPYRGLPAAAFGGWLGGRREVVVRAGAEPSGQVFSLVTPKGLPTQLTRVRGRLLGVEPRPERDQLALLYDRGGDESVQIALFAIPTNRMIRLTPADSRNHSLRWSRDGRELAYASNARTGASDDLIIVRPTRPDEPAQRIEGFDGLSTIEDWGPDDRRLLVVNTDPQRGMRLLQVQTDDGAVETLLPSRVALGVDSPDRPRWMPDGRSIVLMLYDGGDFRRLASWDLEAQQLTILGPTPEADVEAFALSSDGRLIASTFHNEGYSRLRILDAETGRVLDTPDLPKGQISDLAFRPDSTELGFTLETPTEPAAVYSYVVSSRALERWTLGDPNGPDRRQPEPPQSFRYTSFDGRRIPAHIYRPDPHRFSGPRPVLIELHGGPQAQARPRYLGADAFVVSELGMAMIVPNVRGSTGYGRSYMSLDDRDRRQDAVKDVGALLDWVEDQPDLDADRVVLKGGSYGGYLVLAGLAAYGDRVRAGIDIAGIANFETFLENQPPVRRELLRFEFGDPERPEGRSFLRDLSPIRQAERIRSPLLVVHGMNDPRVPLDEARQIVEALRANDVPVWFVMARDEGHGFSKGANREYLRYVEALFLIERLRGD